MSRILVLAVLTAAPCFANSPEEAFNGLLDAVYSGDAPSLFENLSTESVAMVNMMLLVMKASPAASAAEVSSKLGIEAAAGEITGWTVMDLVSTVLSAPGFVSQFPPRDDITVSHCSVREDSSVVFFTVGDIPETFELLLVKQGGSWKLDQSVIQAGL